MAFYLGWLMVILGSYAMFGGAMDWEWFMTHRRAQRLIKLWGREGARAFYVGAGCLAVIIGILAAAGYM